MEFELDEANTVLKGAIRDFLAKESPLEKSRPLMDDSAAGFSREVYAALAELGYLGLNLPEELGGSGVGPIGLTVVLHEMGRVVFPGPFLDLVLSLEMLRRVDLPKARELLDEVARGEKVVLCAREESLAEPLAGSVTPQACFSEGRVVGSKLPVPYGSSADVLLVTTRQGLVLVARPEQGWPSTALATLDHTQRLLELRLDCAGELLLETDGQETLLAEVDRLGALGGAALLLGLMERSLELAVDYLKEREAFGKKIGGFQALQHRAADMWIQVESSRAAVYRAAWALESESKEAPFLVASAKAYCGAAARYVTGQTIQIFGGVGYTWEYDPHYYYKRVKTLEQLYGSTRAQLEFALQSRGI